MIYKILKIDRKTTSTGKLMARLNLKEAESDITVENVSVWQDYPNFSTLDVGHTTEGDVVAKGDFKNLYPARTNPLGFKKSGGAVEAAKVTTKAVEVAQVRKQESIKTFQESKDESIKTSSTFRDATLMAIASLSKKPFPTEQEIKDEWTKWRDWLWKQYDNSQAPF